jgi:hypothetical protein
LNKAIADTFSIETRLLYARHETGAVYISNGHYILKTDATGFADLIGRLNRRKKTADIAVVESTRILDYVNKAKGTFELTQDLYILGIGKDMTACLYKDDKQYFEYNKSYVDLFDGGENRLFVDNAGNNSAYHHLIVKDRHH